MTCSVAVDAMGGDSAPREAVRGAVEAARSRAGELKVLLVGREAEVRAELEAASWDGSNIEIVPADAVIEMGDSPVEALRKKKGSSIEVATRQVREGRADAMVSAGNTGACVAAGTLLLGLLPEVRRAGIAVTIASGPRPVVIIDVGANIAAKPEHLVQYGIMASLFARKILGVENPRLGLLNIGEESAKGTSLARATHALFPPTGLNYVGNLEGGDVFKGGADVVVCDGFVGNIVLKVSEGLAEQLVGLFRGGMEEAFKRAGQQSGGGNNATSGAFGEILRESLAPLREKLDYSEYGGAPLLGVNGVMIMAHGRSDARALSNAIGVATRMAESNLNQHITEEIRAFAAQKEAS